MPRRNTAREPNLVGNRNQEEEDEDLDRQEENSGSVAVGTNGADREDDDDDGGDYGHAERAFLQAFLARSVMAREEVGSLLRRIWRVKAGKNNDENEDHNNDNVSDVRQPTQSDISAAIAKANKALSPLDLAIRSARSQRDSGVTTYALVMLGTVDPLGQSQATQPQPQLNSQYASFGGGGVGAGGSGGVGSSQTWPSPTTYTADEQAYIRRVLDAIFETNNTQRAEVMAVKGMQAVRLHRAPQQQQLLQQQQQDQSSTQDANTGEWQNRQAQTIPMAQAEKLLARLVEEGWLERSEKGWYSLGMRGLIELREWLVETYNGEDEDEDEDEEGEESVSNRRSQGQNKQKWERIKFCDACKDIMTIGQRCSTRTCLARLHDACTDPFFRAVQARKCTRCGAEWTSNAFVGERAAVTTGAVRSSTSLGMGERTSL